MFYFEKGISAVLNYRIAIEAEFSHSINIKKHLLAAAYDFNVTLGNCRQTTISSSASHASAGHCCITADFSASCAVGAQFMQRFLLYREELQLHRVGLDVLIDTSVAHRSTTVAGAKGLVRKQRRESYTVVSAF